MSNYESYIWNKHMHKILSQYQKGGGSCDVNRWDKIKILDTLGSGHYGTTFKVAIDGCDDLYALKRQKISAEEYESPISTLHQTNIELQFYEWINTLNASDRIFFMEMYGYRRFKCDFQSIKSNANDLLKSSGFCQDTLLRLKGNMMSKEIDTLTKNQFLSIFCQMTYAVSLMHSAKYHHRDAKSDNICISPTSSQYIKIGNNKVKTYGIIASLIDYGTIMKEDVYPLNIKKDTIDLHSHIDVDMWFLIDYILLNNTYIYRQIEHNRMGIRPDEVFDIIKGIYRVSPKIYQDVSSMIKKEGNDFNSAEISQDDSLYIEVKKDHVFKALMYEFMQKLQIYHPEEFRIVISSYFKKQINISGIIDYDVVKIVIENRTDLNFVINKIQTML